MTIHPTSVLYYPYIDVSNANWLRNAILYWDNINTIVPEDYKNPYSTNVAKFLEGEGILKPLTVSSDMDEIEDLCDDILEYLTDPASTSILIGEDANNLSQIHPSKLPREIRQFSEIHPMKLPYFVRDYFEYSLCRESFLNVDNRFAAFYMTLLASRLSTRFGLGLATDVGAADHLAANLRKGKTIRKSDLKTGDFRRRRDSPETRRQLPREIANGAMFELMIEGINLPVNIPIKALIKFRQQHSEELGILRREISKLVNEIPEDACTEALRQGINDQYVNNVRPALQSLRKSLALNHWDAAAGGLFKISVISAASTSLLSVLGCPTPFALLAGAGLSLTATATTLVGQQRRTREASQYSYLLALEKKW